MDGAPGDVVPGSMRLQPPLRNLAVGVGFVFSSQIDDLLPVSLGILVRFPSGHAPVGLPDKIVDRDGIRRSGVDRL